MVIVSSALSLEIGTVIVEVEAKKVGGLMIPMDVIVVYPGCSGVGCGVDQLAGNTMLIAPPFICPSALYMNIISLPTLPERISAGLLLRVALPEPSAALATVMLGGDGRSLRIPL